MFRYPLKTFLTFTFYYCLWKTGLGAFHTQPASNFQKYPFWSDVYFFISSFYFTQYFQYIWISQYCCKTYLHDISRGLQPGSSCQDSVLFPLQLTTGYLSVLSGTFTVKTTPGAPRDSAGSCLTCRVLQLGTSTGQWPGPAGCWGLQRPQGTELPWPTQALATSLPWSFLFAPFSSAGVTSPLQFRVSFCSCVHTKAWFGPSFGGLPSIAVFYLPHQAVICKANKRASQHYLSSFQCHLLSVCIFQIQPTLPVITLELVRSLTESPSRVSRAIYTLPAWRRALLLAEAKPPVASSLEPRLSLFV